MIAAICIGRKGSVGFPGKNTFPILGRPLCAYPMLAARNAHCVDELYVSTDDPAIREVAQGFSAKLIERPAELANNQALGEHAFLHAFHEIQAECARTGQELELLVLLMCNAATILADTIERGVAALRENPALDSAVTVSRYNMWSPLRARKTGPDGLLEPFVPFECFGDPNTLNCDRDSQGDVWFADMGVSIVRPHCLVNLDDGLLPQKWMGRKIFPLKQWGGLDVDYEWQFAGVEHWLGAHGFTAESMPYPESAPETSAKPGEPR